MATTALLLTAHATNAQEVPDTTVPGLTVDNNQDQVGAVSSVQTLNVVENDGLTQAQGAATGNAMMGGNQNVDATLHSTQIVRGTIRAVAEVNGTNTGAEDLSLGTPVYITTRAVGNYGAFVADQGNLSANTTQTATADAVIATSAINAPNNAIYISGEGNATTEVNHMAYEVTNGRLDSTAVQTSDTDAKSNASAIVHYSPSPNAYNANATNNYYGSYSGDRGSQEHTVTQTANGDTMARSEVFGGNMWDVASSATAVANNNNLQNQGGSLVVDNHQVQNGAVQAQSVVQSYEYGSAYASATGIGNQLAAGDNDIYVRIDNDQVSSGGVDVSASFDGTSGYDGYVSADATGNQALAYACAECRADMGVNSNQVNNSDVNATATATVGQGRSIVSTARATGNSATYYVSGSSH